MGTSFMPMELLIVPGRSANGPAGSGGESSSSESSPPMPMPTVRDRGPCRSLFVFQCSKICSAISVVSTTPFSYFTSHDSASLLPAAAAKRPHSIAVARSFFIPADGLFVR